MKNRSIIRLSLCFTVFIFWAFFYSNHVLFSEQLSLFLYTSDFWKQHALQPGGWSVYCGNFLAQFYINYWVGALLQTMLFAVLLVLSVRILKKTDSCEKLSPAAVFPAMLLLALQFDYRFTPGNTLALICPFALTLLYMNMPRVAMRRLVFTLAFVPVYLFSGAAATCCLYAVLVIFEWMNAKDRWRYVTSAWLVIAVILPRLWQFVYPIPDENLYQIVDYPTDEGIGYIPVALLAWIPICVLLVRLIPLQRLKEKLTTVIIISLLLACGWYFFPKKYQRLDEQKFGMYLSVLQTDWDQVLQTGKHVKTPDKQAACLINLSLAMKGELPQKMFSYPQTNEYGLLPVHEREILDMLYGSTFFYHIGILNEAIRWIFDSNILRRKGMDYLTLTKLATWNKENGYEQVAGKYFDILSHTLMYRAYAKRERNAPVLQREKTANQVEYYVGGREPLTDLAWHYENNYQNRMILDYMLCCLLLKNDLKKFEKLFNSFYNPPKILPKAYQEALTEMVDFKMTDIRNYPVDSNNEIRLRNFKKLFSTGNEKELEKQFGDTWWYYSYQKMKKTMK